MNTKPHDIAIIGGGIVGLSTAMALTADGKGSVVLLEAEPRLAEHQTGHNSGVIHSGLYYRPGSSKARNCAAGRDAMYRFCEEHGIAHEECGKVVVATRESELPALEELHRRGSANGLVGIRKLAAADLPDFEPHAAGLAGLHVPQTGIVDFKAVSARFAEIAQEQGAEIHTSCRLVGVRRDDNRLVLQTDQGEHASRFLINCAGLHCDRVARLCGTRTQLRIIPFRGEYYELNSEAAHLVRNLIYPVPDPRFPFLGVHFTRMIHGGVEAGPNAVLAFSRHGYRKFTISIRDMVDTFTYPGFWRLALRYGTMGMGEWYRSFSKRAFVGALRRLVPEVTMRDVHRAGAGVRAQAVAPDGRLVDDFQIERDEGMIHVLNAPSPAATASISIGETIARMAASQFEL